MGRLVSSPRNEAALGQAPGTSKPCLHEGSWPVTSHRGLSDNYPFLGL